MGDVKFPDYLAFLSRQIQFLQQKKAKTVPGKGSFRPNPSVLYSSRFSFPKKNMKKKEINGIEVCLTAGDQNKNLLLPNDTPEIGLSFGVSFVTVGYVTQSECIFCDSVIGRKHSIAIDTHLHEKRTPNISEALLKKVTKCSGSYKTTAIESRQCKNFQTGRPHNQSDGFVET